MPEYTDVLESHRRQAAARGPLPAELEAHRRIQGMVALRMESLERGDDWDVYRAHVEGLQGQDEAVVAEIRQRVDDEQLVGDHLARANLRLQRLLGRLEARRDALALPKALRDQAEAEKKLLDAGPGVEGKA